jgi:hypothetical protein
MKKFEDDYSNQDFSLTKKPTVGAKLPLLSAPVEVKTVVVKDESLQKRNELLAADV